VIPLGPVTSSLGTTYTAAQVYAMVMGPSLRTQWLFELLGPAYGWKADLSPYVLTNPTPSLTYDYSRAVKGELSFTMRALSTVNPQQDLIRLRYQLEAPDGGWLEWVIGIYVFEQPDKEIHEGVTLWTVKAPDLSQLLGDAGFEQAAGVRAGMSYATAVAQLVAGYGGSTPLQATILNPAPVLTASQGWDAGVSTLKAINDLLSSAVYSTAAMSGGTLRARPYPDLTQEPTTLLLDTVAGPAKVIGPFSEKRINPSPANVIIVLGEDSRQSPVYARYENQRADSPISLAAGARRKVKTVTDSSIPDNATALARAIKEAQAEARIYSTLECALPPFPWFEDLDVPRLVYQSTDEGLVNNRYLVQSWNCSLSTDPTTVTLQRVVPA
jgi:hypothetical protein